MQKFVPCTALLSICAAPLQAATLPLASITITGGYFDASNSAPSGACGDLLNPCISAGDQNPINTLDGLFEGPSLTSFSFFHTPAITWTAPTATTSWGLPSTSGNPLQGTVDTVAGTLSLDMGSFYMMWGGIEMLQAPYAASGPLNPIVAGTYHHASGAFSITWSSYQPTGPLGGSTMHWQLTGVAAPVPEPANLALMLAGLAFIGAATRQYRRRPAA